MTHLTQITRLDKVRIKKTLKTLQHTELYKQYASFIRKIDAATVIDSLQVPDNLVTMNSCIIYEDIKSVSRHEVILVYPQYEDLEAYKISVLSPLGIAIFGATVGTVTSYQNTIGEECKLRILKIVYQPEMSGHYLI